MAKEIRLNIYKSGRIERRGYYDDLRAASCAFALLEKAGWCVNSIKKKPLINKHYVYAEMLPLVQINKGNYLRRNR